MSIENNTLKTLDSLIQQRRNESEKNSYVATMKSLGIDKMLQKVAEEANEVVLASKNNDEANLIHEVADLWFHTLLVLHQHGLNSEVVLKELESRLNHSGIAEKESRKNKLKGNG